jgi:tetratricopeptide (TPR) repeat protein
MKDFARAREDYGRASRDKAGAAEALSRRVLLSLAEGRLDAAMGDVKALMETAEDDPRGRLLRALVRLEKEEETEGALADSDEAARKLPDDALALTVHARARVMTDPDGAYRDASQALGIIKELYPAYEARALARFLTRDYLGASEDVKRCLELKPDYWRAYSTSALVRLAKVDVDGAIADLTQALERRKEHVPLLLRRADARLMRQLYVEAIADYDRLIALQPAMGEAHAGRAICLIMTGHLADGMAIVDNLIRQVPAFGLMTRGRVGFLQGEFRRAVDDFESAIRTDARMRALIGNQLQEARRRADAVARDPEDWRGFVRRGNQFVQLNNYPEAQKDFLKAFMMLPAQEFSDADLRDLSIAAYNLSCTYGLQAKTAKDEAKAEAADHCFKWLDKAAKYGFLSISANPCDKNPKAHSGREHAGHDSDFDAVKDDPRYRKILDYHEEH